MNEMIDIQVYTKGGLLLSNNYETVTSSSKNQYQLNVLFDNPKWDELNKIATFRIITKDKEVLKSNPIIDNKVIIPWEVLSDKPKDMLISVAIAGMKDDNILFTTSILNLIYKDTIITSETGGEPTLEWWQQFYSLILEQVKVANDAATASSNFSVLAKQESDKASQFADQAEQSSINANVSANDSQDSADRAKASEDNADASASQAELSEVKAKSSADNALTSETKSKLNADAAKLSETNSKTSETNALNAVQDIDTKVKDFNSSYQEKIEEIEDYVENVNSSIETYVGDTEDLNTDDKTNIVNPINEVNAIAKANKDELEKARESFLGDMYEDLYARLMADFSDIYNRFNEASHVPYSDTFINASNTYTGLTSGTEIKGVTVQDQYYIETVTDSIVQFDDGVGEYAVVTSDVDCTLTRCGKNLQKSSVLLTDQGVGWYDAVGTRGINGSYVTRSASLIPLSGTVTITFSNTSDNISHLQLCSLNEENIYLLSQSSVNNLSVQENIYTIRGYIQNDQTSNFGNIMMTLGTVEYPYEPYASETFDITANTPTQIPLLDGTNTFFADTGDNLTVRYLTKTETDETTPSADFPQEMTSVEGDLVVKSVGKNLFPFDTIFNDETTINNGTMIVDSALKTVIITNTSGTCYTSTGVRTSDELENSKKKYAIKVQPDTTYTIKIESEVLNGTKDTAVGYATEYDENYNTIKYYQLTSTSNVFTTDENTSYICMRLDCVTPTIGTTVKYSNIQLELGSTGTTYEPYTEDTTTYSDITLRSLPNGVCDSIENEKLIQRVGVLDINSDWFKGSVSDSNNSRFSVNIPRVTAGALGNAISNIFQNVYPKDDYTITKTGLTGVASYERISITLKGKNISLEEFKELYADLKIQYELVDYIYTDIDTRELRTYDGTTNVFTTGTDVMPIISTKVPSDVTAIVSEQSSQIATQANTINHQADMINEQSSHIAYLESNLNNVQTQSNDTDDVLNELIGGESV